MSHQSSLSKRNILTWLLLAAVLVILTIPGATRQAAAQESTAEPTAVTPVEPVTETPAETPTEAPVEATVEPVSPPEETLAPTGSVTTPAQPTAPAPTVAPDIVQSNFDTGDTSAWLLSDGWTLVTEEINGYLSTDQPGQTATVNGLLWGDFSLNARIGLTTGATARIGLRVGDGRYVITLDASGAAALYRDDVLLQPGTPPADATANPTQTSRSFMVNIIAQAGSIQVFIDSVLQINAVDLNPLPAGLLVFGSGSESTGIVTLDDVIIQAITTAPSAEPTDQPIIVIPPPAEQPTTTPPEVTPPVVPTADPTDIPAEETPGVDPTDIPAEETPGVDPTDIPAEE
ncbi:MAG: hypothetical protein ACOCYT_00480, partial [Chloroflexota bacterium]